MTITKLKTILIVDDDQDILFALSSLLEDEGYIVQVAENGIAALELLKKNLPQLVLLDMIMPLMNGWQFSQEFVSKYDHLCPIVVMTAAADAEQRARDIRASGWIEKPFDLNNLFTIIKKHMKVEENFNHPIIGSPALLPANIINFPPKIQD